MKKVYADLPEWEFEMKEVSANVYQVVCVDKLGYRVEFKGVDLDELIRKCKEHACKIEAES